MTPFAEPIACQPWSPRAALMPFVERSDAGGYVVKSNGSSGCYGGWGLAFEAGASTNMLLASVRARWQDLENGLDSLQAFVQWISDDGQVCDWAPLQESGSDDGWVTLCCRPLNPVVGCRLVLRLLIRWSATGQVEWASPRVEQVEPPRARTVRLGAASARPDVVMPATLETNRDCCVEVCRRAGDAGVDLLCLPETILTRGFPRFDGDRLMAIAIDVPGEHVEPFAAVAREYGMAIAFSVFERDEGLVYNTAVLIDDNGELALKYRKVHLSVAEAWRGVTPGKTFSVARVLPSDVRVGLNICMDSSSAESARIEARLGAEVLMLPIENDFRATMWRETASKSRPFSLPRWTLVQRARAIDNHLYVIAAREAGVGTGIFGPDGSILAMDYGDAPIVTTDVDLTDLRRHPTGPPYRDVLWFQRRESMYGQLVGRTQP